jgi:hypothetical protein
MELTELRQQYPMESLEGRLPIRPAAPDRYAHPERLDKLESNVEDEWKHHYRSVALRRLHEDSVDTFVNSAGFGVGRVARMVDPRVLREALPDRPPVPQPDYIDPFVPPAVELSDALSNWDTTAIGQLHDDGVIDFLNPRGFGYVKDRRHVAGFQRHAMTKVPAAKSAWAVAHLDLVGLVVHEKPVVYVSASLPRMEELGVIPTRPPDEFEAAGLEALRKGEYLYARGTADKVRMIGAIRATRQCVECHGGARGDLLGAFSYGLRRGNG